MYGSAYILGCTDNYGKDDEEYHSVSVIETIEDIVVVSDVDLGD